MNYTLLLTFLALCHLSTPLLALERVAATPYDGGGFSSNIASQPRLPTCSAGQVLTSLGSNTFSCVDTNAVLQSSGMTTSSTFAIGLPACEASHALAVSNGRFICANVVRNAPKCEAGYSLQGNDGVTLSCVKASTSVSCASDQVLTSDQGQLKCVGRLDTVPACAAGQLLTGQNGKLVCTTISATNCNGRITQNWGGYQYCSNLTCGEGQKLTAVDGYLQCVAEARSQMPIMDLVVETRSSLTGMPSLNCPAGFVQFGSTSSVRTITGVRSEPKDETTKNVFCYRR